jgi:hypothetical protein
MTGPAGLVVYRKSPEGAIGIEDSELDEVGFPPRLLPAFAEEVEEEGAGFVFEDAGGDFAAVV